MLRLTDIKLPLDHDEAALTAAVLARLGFHSVRVYHASWFEYGNEPDAPVEKEVASPGSRGPYQ